MILRLLLALAPESQAQTPTEDAMGRAQGARDRLGGVSVPDVVEYTAVPPPVRVLAFEDRSTDNCLPDDARWGLCIEEVDFAGTAMLNAASTPDKATQEAAVDAQAPWTRAMYRNTAELYAEVWEDLAYRWGGDSDISNETLIPNGYTALPEVADTWDVVEGPNRGAYSGPDQDLWLTPEKWDAFYPAVRWYPPESGLGTDLVVADGRFALNLGYQGRPRPADIMEGDPVSSGPFFEQMYPYRAPGDNLAEGEAVGPGAEMKGLRSLPVVVPLVGPDYFEVAAATAAARFDLFTRLLQVQIAQFALEEYTANHIRVLTALTAMLYPPGDSGLGRTGAGNIVAAAKGETDDAAEVQARSSSGNLSFQGGFEINYQNLPSALVSTYIDRMLPRVDDPGGFYAELNDRVRSVDIFMDKTPGQIKSLDRRFDPADTSPTLDLWLDENTTASTRDKAEQIVLRTALQMLMARLSTDERNEKETWLLLDHVSREIASTFDETPGTKVAPKALVDKSSSEWRNTLAKHGYRSAPISQGMGAVDPTAICTTLAGTAAQEETSFGAVRIDILVKARDGLSGSELIWDRREELPFVMMDNPRKNLAKVENLVKLPGGMALYRIRWDLWSGWHILWDYRVSGNPTQPGSPEVPSVAVRTAAVCDNTVLVSRSLVPTLVRGATLDAEFYPTTPVTRLHGRDRIDALPAPLAKLINLIFREGDVAPHPRIDTAEHAYLTELVRVPLREFAQAAGGPTTLVVFDSSRPDRWHPMRDLRPRTPYARMQSRAGLKGVVRTAAWMVYVKPPEKGETPFGPMLFPAYGATESVEAGVMAPRWKRVRNPDINLVWGAGAFPYRWSFFNCNPDYPNTGSVTAPCAESYSYGGDSYAAAPTLGAGISLDMASYADIWFWDDARLAVEIGPEVHLDLGFPGQPLTCDWVDNGDGDFGCKDTTPSYGTSLRPAAGLMFGIRHAVDPVPLSRVLGTDAPWGADGADGSSKLRRTQYGLRGGFLVAPGYNGMEGTWVAEGWAAWSLRRRISPHASFTPYYPGFVIGPYARYQYGFLWQEDADNPRYYELDHSNTVIIGVRAQMRVKGGEPPMPEIPQ